jgi:hypothetical protein
MGNEATRLALGQPSLLTIRNPAIVADEEAEALAANAFGTGTATLINSSNPVVAPAPEKAPKFLDQGPANAPQPQAPAPVYVPPTYAQVGSDTYQPQTRVSEGRILPQDRVLGYDWQETNLTPTDIKPQGVDTAQWVARAATADGWSDPQGNQYRIQSGPDGKPRVLKMSPVMGTSADVAINTQAAAGEAQKAELAANTDLELGKMQAQQGQVDRVRTVEDEILKREQRRNTNLDIANAHYSQMVSDLEDEKINPSHQFQKLTPAGRMARVVYLFTAGMRGPEYLTLAMDQLNKDVDRDIAAQKSAIDAKKDRANSQLQVIRNIREQYDTERDADNAMHAVTLRRVSEDIETQIQGVKSEAMRAQLEAAKASVDSEVAKYEAGVESDLAPTVKEAETFDPKRTVQTSGGRWLVPPGGDPVASMEARITAIENDPNATSKDWAEHDRLTKAVDRRKESGGKKGDDPMMVKDSDSRTGYEVLANADQLDTLADQIAEAQKQTGAYVPGTPAFNRRVALQKSAVPLLQIGKSDADQKLAESRVGAFRDPERNRVNLKREAQAMRERAYGARDIPNPKARSGSFQ